MSAETANAGVWGVVLAAGESRRMGSLKQLLPYGNVTMVEAVVDVLLSAQLQGVLVVLGHQAERVYGAVQHLPVRCVINPRYPEGMLTSVQCAVRALPKAFGICVALVDQPAVPASVVRAVAERVAAGAEGIVVPVHAGRRGHPVAISLQRYRDEVLGLPASEGLRMLLQRHPNDVAEVNADTSAVLRDVDLPDDYAREVDRLNQKGLADEHFG
jgi:molybdenum cofactor cytidylyltransferase